MSLEPEPESDSPERAPGTFVTEGGSDSAPEVEAPPDTVDTENN
jgi:hypothetical protein